MYLEVGDKIRLKGRDITGRIMNDRLTTTSIEYYVKYDQDVFPQADWHEAYQLELLERPKYCNDIQCECGCESIGYKDMHTPMCPKYKEPK